MTSLSPGDWQAITIIIIIGFGLPVAAGLGVAYIWRAWQVWQPCAFLIAYAPIQIVFAWQYGRVTGILPPPTAESASLRPSFIIFSISQLALVIALTYTFKRVGEATAARNAERARMEALHRDFIGIMSHEMLTPITIVKGHVDMLLQEDVPDHIHENIDGIGRGLRRLLLTANLFDATNQRVAIELFNLYEMIRLAIADPLLWTATHHRAGDIQILFAPPGDKLMIQSDKKKLQTAVSELIRNAIKVSRTGDLVRVSIRDEEPLIYISVTDQNGGIAKEHHESIWQPGVQLYEEMIRRPLEGSGSGLPAVKRIAEMLGGRAYLEQTAVGMGSVFSIQIPKRRV